MVQLGLNLGRAYENRQLFSDHFLRERLRRLPVWEEVAPRSEALRQRLRRDFRDQQAALQNANERQTEERWIAPVLRALGWGYQTQPRVRRHGTTQYPDYALFPSQKAADDAAGEEPRRVLKRAVGVLEAKRWERSLDARGSSADEDANRVPSSQVINYLIRSEQPWGVLSNGSEWRLYFRDADFADTVFFSVDLPALLGDDPLALGEADDRIVPEEAFRYFYLFFRPEAFGVDAGGDRWLDEVRERSERYARAVEEQLKPRAYRAVTGLCRGFARAQGWIPGHIVEDEELARTVLDNSLTLLFRLLFLLYAEARDLLPVRTNPAYRDKSLLALRERAARSRDEGRELFPRGQDLWRDLQDLFGIVDGDPRWSGLGIAVYNGGLFDPAKHPWLEDHYVSDPELAEALDLLSRVEDPDAGGLHFVDYGPLDVRHLGSIYEGLLEYRLRLADEELQGITRQGRVVRDPVGAGDLYLATERGERHVTGSYYTPDYVVQYIVQRTLEPLVRDRSAREILALRVLDPAMGSGHFLVAATAFLARAAVRASEESSQREIGDFARLDPDHLKRLVVERCIFGVDINPRAVELAKLALWLSTVRRDKPLNFLDHHLHVGNSLVGASLSRLHTLPTRKGGLAAQEEAGQYDAFEGVFRQMLFRVLGFIHQIEALPSDSLRDVELKEKLFGQADTLLDRFREVGNVWVSALFGNRLEMELEGRRVDRLGDEFSRAVSSLRAPEPEWEELRQEDWFQRGRRLAEEYGFFHWEMEFPEAFFAENGAELENPGFDAIVGNPPYVRVEKFERLKDFLRGTYKAHETRSDLYVYFVERSLELLRKGGQYGAIVSNKFLRANYGAPLRALLGERAGMREIVDFGELPVFEDAAAMPALLFFTRGGIARPGRFAAIPCLEFTDLAAEVSERAFPLAADAACGEEWRLVPHATESVLDQMEAVGEPLGSLAWGGIGRGIVTGRNSAFFIDGAMRERLIHEDRASEEVIRPLVIGDEVRRYHLDRGDHWLLYLPHGIDIERYPAVRRYLEPFREDLEARATNQAWFELQQPQEAYEPFFEGPKILYPEMAMEARFAFHPGPLYPNNKCFFIAGRNDSLLAVLNSRVAWFYLRQTAAKLESRTGETPHLELRQQYLERLPVPPALPAGPEADGGEAQKWLEGLYFRGLRRAGIPLEIPEDVRRLAARIGELPEVKRVVLIGSFARGNAGEESDVDLLVVCEENGPRPERRRRIREHVGAYERRLDLHVYTPAELSERAAATASFEHHVLEEGIPLYGSDE